MDVENNIIKPFPNQGRQLGIDLAKCLAIVFMVIIHCLMYFGADRSSVFYEIFDLICGSILAAPVFMTAMGVGLAYSSKSDPKKIIFRGINILILGYVLNIVRVLPEYIIAGIELDMDLLFETVYIYTLCGDIFAFAGLALILFGLLRYAKLKDHFILLIGLALSLIVTFVPIFVTSNIILNCFTGLFIPTMYDESVNMFFPLFSWFIFPCFGYWYGNRLKRVSRLSMFHLIVGLVGVVTAIMGFTLSKQFQFGFVGEATDMAFYGMVSYDAIFCIGASVGFFALCHFITKILPKPLQKGCMTMSNALNLIHICHWPMLLYIAMPLVYYGHILPLWAILLIGAGVIIAATTLGILLKATIKKKTAENPHSLLRYLNAG